MKGIHGTCLRGFTILAGLRDLVSKVIGTLIGVIRSCKLIKAALLALVTKSHDPSSVVTVLS